MALLEIIVTVEEDVEGCSDQSSPDDLVMCIVRLLPGVDIISAHWLKADAAR